MKFAFLIFKVFEYGGAQRDMLRIAHDLVVLGHQVTVFTGEWRTHPPIDGIQYKLLPTHGFTNHQRHQSLITAMQSAVIDDDFDFVVGFNRMAYLDAYYAADPCFMARAKETRGWWYRFTARYKFFATSEAAVFGALSNTQVLLLTQGDQTVFQRYYATPASRFHLLQPNIPLNKFVGLAHATCRHYLRLEFGLPAEAKVVMTVGSAYLRKGVDRTMQALASLPTQLKENTWLVSLGELESTSNFKRDAHRLGVAERCIEAGGRSDVAKLMMGADVLAHPARNELAGIVLIEALVAQLPVIVTDVCGYANHIQAAGGTVLPAPYSQESMNSALRLMLAEDNTHIKQAAQSYIASLIQLASTYAEANLLVKLASQQDVYATTQHDNVILPKRMLKHLRQKNLFDYFMQMQGKVFRDVSGRKTIQVSLNDQSYFIKQHFGVGWGEIAKNLITFKKPILSALTEVSAIKKLTKIGIATTPLVAYGKRGCNPASQQSFLVTEDLGDIISVEELCEKAGKHLWQGKSAKFKHELLQKMAELAAKLHGAGLCHRDFYLCHLVLKKADLMAGNLHLYLIDLHRMANGCSANGSEVMKDIAAFYFSAKLNGFSDQDLMVFRQHYLVQSAVFWQRVEARADSLLVKFNSDKFQAKIANERAKLG